MPRLEDSKVSVCVLTQNEELNIGKCLKSLKSHTTDVWVIDSDSTDRTAAIAAQHGAKVLPHTFLDWATQRNWALENAGFANEWVLFLDADEEMTPDAWAEIEESLDRVPADVDAFKVYLALRFLGRTLPHAYNHPPIVRLVRKTRVRWNGEGAREYPNIAGLTATICTPLWHEDARGLKHWLTKQINNAGREAKYELAPSGAPLDYSKIPKEQRFRLRIRTKIWIHLPPIARALAYFIYRYLFKRGFLDGREGFYFCFFHSLWYPIVIAALKHERRIAPRIVPTDGSVMAGTSLARHEDPN